MKIRTDFVTNSSSSSYCVEITVNTVDGQTFGLSVDPHDMCSSGSDSNIYFKNDEMVKIRDAKDIPSLCKQLIELIDLENDIDFTLDFADIDPDEADVSADVKNAKDNEEALKLLSRIDNGYNKVYENYKDLLSSMKDNVHNISDVKEVIFERENYAWGEFAAEDFWGIWMDGVMPEGEDASADEIKEKLKENFADGTDYQRVTELFKTKDGPSMYDIVSVTRVDMQTGDVKKEDVIKMVK